MKEAASGRPGIVLTDSPQATGDLVPGIHWSPAPAPSLPPRERALWHALSGAPRVWRGPLPETGGGPLQPADGGQRPADTSLPPPARFWSRLVITADAPASQFDALRTALSGSPALAPEPVACLALAGRGFHGQRGRAWAAAPGNLYLSAVVFPGVPAAEFGPAFTMLPAVAVVDAIGRATAGALRPRIKWVNDILLGDRKVAGVLTATQVQGRRLEAAVLGIGINVAASPDVPPSPFVPAVGHLDEVLTGERVPLRRVLWATLAALAERYRLLLDAGPDSLFETYMEASVVIGRRVRIWHASASDSTARPQLQPIASGTVRGIARDLSIVLEGRREPVTGGRLAFEEVCAKFGL